MNQLYIYLVSNVAFQKTRQNNCYHMQMLPELTLLFNKRPTLEGGGSHNFSEAYAKYNLVYLNISIFKWWKLE